MIVNQRGEKKSDDREKRKGEVSSFQATQKANPVVMVISSLSLGILASINGK